MGAGNAEFRPVEMEGRQASHEIVGRVDSKELGDVHRLLADEAGGIADAAHGGIFHQRLDRRWARNADMDGKVDAGRPQALGPVRHRARLEQELGSDKALEALLLEIGLLEAKRGEEGRVAMDLGDIGIALGMAGDPDLATSRAMALACADGGAERDDGVEAVTLRLLRKIGILIEFVRVMARRKFTSPATLVMSPPIVFAADPFCCRLVPISRFAPFAVVNTPEFVTGRLRKLLFHISRRLTGGCIVIFRMYG